MIDIRSLALVALTIFGCVDGLPWGNWGQPTSTASLTVWPVQSFWTFPPTTQGPSTTAASTLSAGTTPTTTSTVKISSLWSVGTTASLVLTSTNTISTSLPSYSSASLSRPSSTAPSSTRPSIIRGVNIGGWLVLEKWMTPDLFSGTDAVDQWSFDSTDGAAPKLKQHWDGYFTEDDVQKIASWGINTLRIPIGFWSYDNFETPYLQGADAYLERAIGWARSAGLRVLVDCHGSPGSQNGHDNSGHSGNVDWQSGDNMQKSISVLTTIAAKYGSMEYADVVFAIELVNEPILRDQNSLDRTQTWAQEAYLAVKAVSTNENLLILMQDGFVGPSKWLSVGSAINGVLPRPDARFAIDTHLYQNQVAADSGMTLEEHIGAACNWTQTNLLSSSDQLPVFVGEFSAQTDICAAADGSITAGTSCFSDGCQCSNNVPVAQWNQPLIDATRKFVEAQLDVFEHSSQGWFIWSYKGPGAWGLANAVQYGMIGKNVTDRKFPKQCDF